MTDPLRTPPADEASCGTPSRVAASASRASPPARPGFRKCSTERNRPGVHDAPGDPSSRPRGLSVQGRREVAVVRERLGGKIAYAAIPLECPPFTRETLARATGLQD